MTAIQSVSTALRTIRDHPILLAGGLLFAAFGELSALAQLGGSVVGFGLSLGFLLVWPFVIAGLIGMIDAGLDGDTGFDRFLAAARSNYLSMLGAFLLFVVTIVAVYIGMFVLTMVVGLVGGVALFSLGDGGALGAGLLLLGLFLASLLVVFLVFVFLQFLYAAVVVSDAGAIGSLSKSAGLVRANFLSVLGYSVIFLLLTFVPRIPDTVLFFTAVELPDAEAGTGYAVVSEPMLALSVALGLLLGTLAATLAWTYHVSFYRSMIDESDAGSTGSPA